MKRQRVFRGYIATTPDFILGVTDRPRKAGKRLAADGLRAARNVLVQDLQEVESRAHGLGMHVTARALNRAKNAAGWEIAGNIDEAARAARKE